LHNETGVTFLARATRPSAKQAATDRQKLVTGMKRQQTIFVDVDDTIARKGTKNIA
jgi:hypothetical protein